MISAKSEVQLDTPEVRVTEWRLAPGSATGHHITRFQRGAVGRA